MDKVLCIGAAHIDRKATAQSDVLLGTSIPVSVSASLGGVARNVAENLARLQCPGALLSRIGNDAEGEMVLSGCRSLNIDTRMLSRSTAFPTASYTALIDRKGDMIVGLANMEIYDELTPSLLEPLMPEMQKHSLWFVDTNLPVATLKSILASSRRFATVFVDPVSVAKAKKLQGLLANIDYLFPSRDEAEALSGISIRTGSDAERAGKKLCGLGVKHAVITLGAEGVCVTSAGSSWRLPALAAASVHDVTGAGDALAAGVIFGIVTSLPLGASIRFGIAAATLTIETDYTVNPLLSAQLLSAKAKEIESCA